MKRFCFYCAMPELVPQAASGAFAPVDSDHWRVTATLTAVSPRPAYAVTDGALFFQHSVTPGRLNCVLIPDRSPAFPDTRVQYIVYRGIQSDSLVEADGQTLRQGDGLLERLWNDQLLSGTAFSTSPTAKLAMLGAVLPGAEDTDLKTLLNGPDDALAPYVRPRVQTGDYLGDFSTDSVSIEIVLADPVPVFTLAHLRSAENILAVDVSAGQDDAARRFIDTIQRDQLLAYLDPCHFFTALRAQGALEFKGGPAPNLATWIATWWTGIYSYFDIRNEHDRSLNFYRNYGPDVDAPPSLRIQRWQDIPHQVDYDTGGWPLLRANLTTGDLSTILIQLPTGDNGVTKAHVSSAAGDRFVSLNASQQAGFSTPIRITMPREDSVWLPSLIKIRYLRPFNLPAAQRVGFRPSVTHRLDNLLDLALLGGVGQVRPPNRSMRIGQLRRVFVDVQSERERFFSAWLAVAVDEAGIYLFASRENRRLVGTSPPLIRSPKRLIGEDRRLAAELPIKDLPLSRIDWNATQVHVADTSSLSIAELAGVAVTRDEYDHLVSQAAGISPRGGTARLSLLHQDTLPDGLEVYTLSVQATRIGAAGILESIAPTPGPEAPVFYVREQDPAFFFSDRYLQGLPADAAEHPFAHSFIVTDNRVTIRRSPRIERIENADWNAAGHSHANIDDTHHNAIGQTTGRGAVPITVLGKRRGDDGHSWFRIRLNEETELIGPSFIESNFARALRQEVKGQLGISDGGIPIAGRTFVPTEEGDLTGWVRRSDAIIVVSDFHRFERDLKRLLEALRSAHPDDSLIDLITRLRMLTKERHSLLDANIPTQGILERLVDGEFGAVAETVLAGIREGALARMFDFLIGTVRTNTDGALVPSVDPDRGLENEILDKPEQQEIIDGEQVNTALELFRDYTAFYLDGDYVIDFHAIFAGLDVVRGQKTAEERRFDATALRYAQGFQGQMTVAGIPLSFVPDDFEHIVPDAVAASLWVGDSAAYYSIWKNRNHRAYEADWITDHGENHPLRDATFRKHYYEASAPDHNLLPDVLAYLLRHDLTAKNRRPGTSPHHAIVDAFQALSHSLPQRGPSDHMRFFERDLRRKAPSDDLIAWMEQMIANFSELFEIRGRVQQAILATDWQALVPDLPPPPLDLIDPDSIADYLAALDAVAEALRANLLERRGQILAEVELVRQSRSDIEAAVKVFDADGNVKPLASTTQFIDWYHRRGGIDFLDR